jgi:hypothetical protein
VLTSISTNRRDMRNTGELHSGHVREKVAGSASTLGCNGWMKRLLIVMI